MRWPSGTTLTTTGRWTSQNPSSYLQPTWNCCLDRMFGTRDPASASEYYQSRLARPTGSLLLVWTTSHIRLYAYRSREVERRTRFLSKLSSLSTGQPSWYLNTFYVYGKPLAVRSVMQMRRSHYCWNRNNGKGKLIENQSWIQSQIHTALQSWMAFRFHPQSSHCSRKLGTEWLYRSNIRPKRWYRILAEMRYPYFRKWPSQMK